MARETAAMPPALEIKSKLDPYDSKGYTHTHLDPRSQELYQLGNSCVTASRPLDLG